MASPAERQAAALETLAQLGVRQARREVDRERAEREDRGWDSHEPRRLDMAMIFRAVPSYAAQFRTKIPDEYLLEQEDGVEVACPCGNTPLCPVGQLVECDGTPVEGEGPRMPCGRWFINTSRSVRVATALVGAPTESA